MEKKKFNVFSMLANTIVFSGTKDECENYMRLHTHDDDSLYIVA